MQFFGYLVTFALIAYVIYDYKKKIELLEAEKQWREFTRKFI